MIGIDGQLTPSRAAPPKNPVAALGGLRKPQYISDASTEDAANNAIAKGYQTGPRTSRQGFSRSAIDRMRSAQEQAAGVAAGAREAAGIRAEDQAANSQMRSAYQQMLADRLLNNQSNLLEAHAANWQRLANERRNRQQTWMNQAQNAQATQLAFLRGLLD